MDNDKFIVGEAEVFEGVFEVTDALLGSHSQPSLGLVAVHRPVMRSFHFQTRLERSPPHVDLGHGDGVQPDLKLL